MNVAVDPVQLSTDSSSNQDTVAVGSDQLRNLPVFDQDFVAALTPFLDPGSGSSGGATIIVDGVEMKASTVSPSAIEEVRINNDPYSTEFRSAGRGRIEILTKPGTPVFHGEVNFIVRDAVFNAKNYFAPTRAPESRRIYEGHLSGPVRFLAHGAHTSFIVSGSYRQKDTYAAVNADTPSGPVRQNVATPSENAQYSGRITNDFSPGHRLAIAYSYESFTAMNANVGGITLAEAGFNQYSREDDVIFNDRWIVTPKLINQLLITLEKDEDVTVSVNNAPSIQVSGSFTGGGAQADLARTENTLHFNDTVSWSHKNHYIRAGIQLPQLSRRAIDDHTNRLGTYKFASLATCGAGTPTCVGGTAYVFTQQQGVGRGLYNINEVGAYFQDQVKLSPHVQLLFGVRYDWQTFLPDYNNFSPRISVAYAPGKGKTIFRGGSGFFYDRTGGDNPMVAVLHDGVILRTVQLQNVTYPVATPVDFSTLPTNITRFDPKIRTQYNIQYSFGVERQLDAGAVVTAGYRGQLQVKAFRSVDINAPILPPNPVLTANYPRPNPTLGQVQELESGGRNVQNAIDLGFRGRAGRWFSGQAQYTFAHYNTNAYGLFVFPQNQYRPNDEYGRATYDQHHRFVLIGNINPGHWLSVGVSATLYSGLPYNETTGNDDYHTGLGNARPAGVARNTLQGGGVADLDVLYNHDFALTKAKGESAKVLNIGVSAFNVLNHTNYLNYIGALTSPLFGQPTAAQPGRQLQISAGFRF